VSIEKKLAKPVTEIIEHIAQDVPKALGHGHHRIAKAADDAADEFDKVEDDIAAKARRHDHPGGTPQHPAPGTGGGSDKGGGGGKKPPTPSAGPPEGEGTPPSGRRRRPKMPPKDTPEGKKARWERYQKRVQDPKYQAEVEAGKRRRPLDYDSWSNVYDSNITQHARAAAAVDDYANRHGLTPDNGWTQEHPVEMGNGRTRRIDLAHPGRAEGIEYKNGAVPNDEKLHAEVEHDTALINRGWNIKWVFRKQPPGWLTDKLDGAGIPWHLDDGSTPAKD
jgi:hypothetical protein